MGWDCFYSGKLESITLQKKVIEFLSEYFDGDDYVVIKPAPEKKYRARGIDCYPIDNYPFNFYGYIGSIYGQAQFVFDRSDGGRLISFYKFPWEHYAEKVEKLRSVGMDRDDGLEWEAQVEFADGGDDRSGYLLPFALSIVKLRWWSDLRVSDSSRICKAYLKSFSDYNLEEILKNDNLGLNECYEIWKEHSEGFSAETFRNEDDVREYEEECKRFTEREDLNSDEAGELAYLSKKVLGPLKAFENYEYIHRILNLLRKLSKDFPTEEYINSCLAESCKSLFDFFHNRNKLSEAYELFCDLINLNNTQPINYIAAECLGEILEFLINNYNEFKQSLSNSRLAVAN